MPDLSVVVPMYDEQAVIPLFVARLRPVLDDLGREYEVVVVDDGSRDTTPALLEKARRDWPELRVVRLRANAGHQAALSAGLQRARGNWVATIDADLQDPPETLADMLTEADTAGVDVVYGVRSDRSSDSPFKRFTAGLYYRMIRRLVGHHVPSDAGDFRLMSRATVDAVNRLPEQNRVLRLATWFGLGGALVTAILLAFAVIAWLSGHTVPGWTSTFVAVASVGAIQLLCVGLLGEYVGRMYTQLQGRPTYYIAYDSSDED